MLPGWAERIGHPRFFLSSTLLEPSGRNACALPAEDFGRDAEGFREGVLLAALPRLGRPRGAATHKSPGGSMFRRLALAFGLLLSFTAAAAAQTADDIVAKSIAAQGLEKMKSVQTRRMTGTMTITVPGAGAPKIEGTIVVENKRPMKTRATLTIQGTENVQAYDGENAWTLMPAENKPIPGPASADELKDLRQQADMDGELVDYKAKGSQAELLGREKLDGSDAWRVKLTRKDGDVQYVYLDPDSALEIRVTTIHRVRGTEEVSDADYGSYQQVAGAWFPFAIEGGDIPDIETRYNGRCRDRGLSPGSGRGIRLQIR